MTENDCENSLNQDVNPNKTIIINKLNDLIEIFEDFEVCSNQTLLLGSLDYFRLALNREKLKKNDKKELFKVINEYLEYIENYFFTYYSLADNLIDLDLSEIDEKFDSLQNYVSDLEILPRLYDEDVDLSIFCQ